jgi:hypothetical protein
MRPIVGPVYVACEGPTDCAFVRAMVCEEKLQGFNVGCPADIADGSGRSAIPRLLRAVLASTDGSKIRSLAVFIDNNGSPDKALEFGREVLAEHGYLIPDPPGILEDGGRKVGLYLIPAPGIPGTLEHLLVEAVLDLRPQLRECLEGFETCTKAPLSWSANQRAKMRLGAIIASHCSENPLRPAQCLWQSQENPIPRTSERFDGVRAFLRSLAV